MELGVTTRNVKLQYLVLMQLFFTTLYFNPFIGLDPYNFPKMTLLLFFTVISFLYFEKFRPKDNMSRKWIYFGVGLWIFSLCVTFVLSSDPLSQKIYGTPGRNQGFVTMLCFVFLTLQSMQISTVEFADKVRKIILAVGLILVPYSFSQYFGYDFSNLANIYNQMPIGTFGNPNFNSVMLAFIGLTCTWTLFYQARDLPSKLFFLGYLITIYFLIYVTKSAQGFWSLAIGCLVIFYSHIQERLSLRLKGLTLVTTLGAFFLTLLGMFSLGPMSQLGEIDAVRVRIYYWLSGICTGNQSPLFGVGFDGYGDWYRRCRPEQAFLWDPNRVTDVSHNIYIDYYATGGLILVTSFSILIIATIKKISSIYKTSGDSTKSVSLLISIFVAFLAQGTISINQIGLAIWGWILMGLILGFPIENQVRNAPKTGRTKNSVVTQKNSKSILKFISVILAIGLTLLPPTISSEKFKSAIEQGNPIELEKSLFDWPEDRARVRFGIQILMDSEQVELAKSAIVKAVEIYPDDYFLWQTYQKLFIGTDRQDKALFELNRLDPRIEIKKNNSMERD